ncbi:TPA: hypothetical protein DF272_02120 [Candidatus Falkowbacteria bacterium]|nr:hypothetical protein [Candidatus Falkowbacteria bacterium]
MNISVKNVTKNNLKNFSVIIPLKKLVAIVGPSGSGKSTLVQDVLFQQTKNPVWEIKNLPAIVDILEQKVILPADVKQSLGEFNLAKLKAKLKKLKPTDLLIVDEPCAGFCQKERKMILKLLKDKVKLGYSIVAVEHNKEIIAGADYVIELGPGAGRYGGKLMFEGSQARFKKSKTVTAKHVYQNKNGSPDEKIKPEKSLTISNISEHGLKKAVFRFPLHRLVGVTGCSGSGKTTMIDAAYRALFKGKNAWKIRLKTVHIEGKQYVRRSYIVPQAPIGDHPSSTLATYTNVWDNIRETFSNQPSAKKQKLAKSAFVITKDILDGTKTFNPEILKVRFHGKNIKEVLGLTIDEAIEIFGGNTLIRRKLQFLQEAGLGYLVLGQRSGTLSGGEAQRVRIANILSKKLGDRSVYIFDTPSRGLHLKDSEMLLNIFRKIIGKNNTILIAENREEILSGCDSVITL